MDLTHKKTQTVSIPEKAENVREMVTIERVLRKDGFPLFRDFPSTTAQTATNYGQIFTALFPCEVMLVAEVHTVAGTSVGTVTLDIEKCTGTTAIGAGTSILATAFNLKSTAYTPVFKSGVTLSTARQLATGDRLALKTSGTLTSLEGVQVTLNIKPLGKGDYR